MVVGRRLPRARLPELDELHVRGAPNFKRFLLDHGRGRVVWAGFNPDRYVSQWIGNIQPGDLVIADLTWESGKKLNATHNMFITTVRRDKKFVGLTYHGADNPADRNLFKIVRKYRHPRAEDGRAFYWIVHVYDSGPEPDEAFYWPNVKHL